MKKLVTILFGAALFLGASCEAFASEWFEFGARLSGLQEPSGPAAFPGPIAPQTGAVTSPPTVGDVVVQFVPELTHAFFQLRVFHGVGITQAHLHCGPAGVNGPIVIFLFGLVPAGVSSEGVLASSVLTNAGILSVDFAANPSCGMTINNIASLHAAVLQGKIYANVHSTAFPAGVTRGQLTPGRP